MGASKEAWREGGRSRLPPPATAARLPPPHPPLKHRAARQVVQHQLAAVCRQGGWQQHKTDHQHGTPATPAPARTGRQAASHAHAALHPPRLS